MLNNFLQDFCIQLDIHRRMHYVTLGDFCLLVSQGRYTPESILNSSKGRISLRTSCKEIISLENNLPSSAFLQDPCKECIFCQPGYLTINIYQILFNKCLSKVDLAKCLAFFMKKLQLRN